MSWQIKLRRLIDVSRSHPTLGIGLSCNSPVDLARIDQQANVLTFSLPSTLRELYAITDGLIIGVHFNICGLVNDRFGPAIGTMNGQFLDFVRENNQANGVSLIFGTDGSTGDFLAVTDRGAVRAIAPDNPEVIQLVADLLDIFLDSVCLGPGYIQYYRPSPDNFWVPVLQEFGFLDEEQIN